MRLQQWFSLKGRISRETWWIFYFLFPNGIMLAIGMLDARVLPKIFLPPALGKGLGEISVVLGLALFVWVWLSLAGQVKRWHDQNKTGWWGCLTSIPIFFGAWLLFYSGGTTVFLFVGQLASPLFFLLLVGFGFGDPNINPLVAVGMIFFASTFIFIWALFFVNGSLLRGTPGPNRFGPDPLAPPDTTNIAPPPKPQ